MEEHKESYYMNIPATVWDSKLRANCKLCYGHITVLANKKGYAYASNAYFAKALGVSKTTASQYISELIKLGVITSQIILHDNSKEVKERRIYLASIAIKESFNGPVKENDNGPIKDNFKGNTTSNNTTRTNSKLDVPSDTDDILGKIFFKVVDLYPKNRIGNRQHGLKKFKQLDIKQAKLALINLKRYLTIAGAYVKSLQNYIQEECYSEAWLTGEEETKNKKTNINNKPDTKTFNTDYGNF